MLLLLLIILRVSFLQIDYRQSGHFTLKRTPDVLISPSRLQHLAKDHNGTLIINPGFLTKMTSGGTYAELTIHPMSEDHLKKEVEKGGAEGIVHDVCSRVEVTISRI